MLSPKAGGGRRARLIAAALLLAYFFLVSWDTVKAHFAPDEMASIWWYWHASPWQLLSSQVLLWQGLVRPFAAVYYLPLYLAFGLNPAPYHVALLLLVLLGAWLMYRMAGALGSGELAGAIVALIACYHGGLSNLYYNGAFVYDVLAGIFYFAAFGYYVRIRSTGRPLTFRQSLAFLALFVCGLNSKEMAVTLPAMLLAYECLFHAVPWRPRDLLNWLRGPGSMVYWTGVLNLIFLFGKRFWDQGLINGPSDAYRPAFSLARAIDFQERSLGDLFYHLPRLSGMATLLIWIAATALAWRTRRPLPRFAWIWMAVTPLPIEFLEGRDRACLFVCLAGWAILAALLFSDFAAFLAPKLAAIDPQCRRWGAERTRVIFTVAAMAVYAMGAWSFKQTTVDPQMPGLGALTYDVLAQFRAMNPRVAAGSTVVFLQDPWHNHGYDMAFISELWFGDRRTRVLLNEDNPLTPEEIAKANAVFTWQDGRLIRVR